MNPTTATTPLLEVTALVRQFGGRTVLGPLDLDVGAGSRVAVVGPNGSGKSTLLRCVAGTLTPTSGRVAIDGYEAGTLAARARVGVSLSQERSFDLRLSGRANLLFFARLRAQRGRDAEQIVADLENELELHEIAAQRVANCSTGMTQQLSFARALLRDPPLLLLDEPTRSLDDEARARMWAALDRRPDQAVLIATHRDDDVERCRTTLALGG
jgi:ABC-2 type transport system ATP-binding protein